MLKLANPIHYPIAVAIGGLTLVLGVRLLRIPNPIIIPSALGVTVLGASVLKSRELDGEGQLQKTLEQELKEMETFSETLVTQSEEIRQEVSQKLAQESENLDTLVKVQEVCDRFAEVPSKIRKLSHKMTQKKSLLSWDKLTQKKADVDEKIQQSSGISRQQLEQLSATLEENLQQIEKGLDSRQSQVIYLNTLLQTSAGNLQQLYNNLHNYTGNNSEQFEQLNQTLLKIEEQHNKLEQWLN
jgi:glucose-6-phosphate-specific signal transduction histidine kinase